MIVNRVHALSFSIVDMDFRGIHFFGFWMRTFGVENQNNSTSVSTILFRGKNIFIVKQLIFYFLLEN